MRKNILVTGPPGCGKSTLIMQIAGKIGVPARGFTTAEIRSSSGAREGFRIATLSGTEGILAHRNLAAGPRVGSYRVNLGDIDEVGAAELEAAIADPATRLIVVDEIARMELFSHRFRRAIEHALASQKPLLGTLQLRRDPFLDAIRSRSDTIIIAMARDRFEESEHLVLSALSRVLER